MRPPIIATPWVTVRDAWFTFTNSHRLFFTVAKHNTADSCWVVLYGKVYDVTDFLPEHPGGKKIILKLAGKDATEEYDPVHPPGILEENLSPENFLGTVDEGSLPQSEVVAEDTKKDSDAPPPLGLLMNLDEIEEEATKRISKKAWAYYFSASDDLRSKSFNNLVYQKILLRPRVFVDCTSCDLSTNFLGHKVGMPIFVAPAAMARLAHPDGEQGIAKACARFGAMQIVSNNASMTPEQIVEGAAPGQVFGWQLYVQNQREKSEAMLRRINAMRDHYKFITLTLDAPVPGKRELDEKSNFDFADTSPASGEATEAKGGVGQQLFFGTAADLTWKTTLSWLSEHTDLPIVLKGLQTHEDVYLATKYPQVKAVILSNHGGRALDTAPPAIHTLLEIRKYCPEVLTRLEVYVDGGIKRGTDVVKALCLGATGVGIGRGALFGLGAGGQAGVERVLEILEGETSTCLRLLGVKNISELGPRLINARSVERDIYDGDPGLERRGLWSKSKL
ncbi:FMN-dependent dehydrogenase-domain-containing protein [Ilyonectria robusta]|uniref:FMN-dependent dehydrogenase-domain-containing protein n=1 Tax=Ilyonectria robusta TaxID=1079257 RepID=UPI001E8DAF55|nr:FMN-dependent dehydrogenase-domain-containing protein [Ilyonectria robusta]KAH8737036.1 FMN-dependent dehydrogenase-domain-containing protein [Ilyonectria robusta]